MDDRGEPLARRALKVALVLLLHALVLGWLLQQQFRASQKQELVRMDVRMLNELPPPPPAKPKPLPPLPQAVPQAAAAPPPPIMTAAPGAAAPAASFAVPPQPPAPARELPPSVPVAPQAAPASPPPPPITAARFDADYLKNPAPAYPAMSRRLGEEGRVLLLVRVTPQGLPDGVEVRESSGFARLDEAALVAVRQWRFVPARRGNEAIAASVLVPIIFRRDG